MRTLTAKFASGISALLLVVWTATGESADPTLSVSELPRGLFECSPQPQCFAAMPLTTHWLARTPTGNLFTVTCSADAGCGAWLVEKQAREVTALLELSGAYEFFGDDAARAHRGATAGGIPRDRYPHVRLREAVADHAFIVRDFVWVDRHYQLRETRQVYVVDGVECGTKEQCHQAAVAATRIGRDATALRIWSLVHQRHWY